MNALESTFLGAALSMDPFGVSFEDSVYIIPYEITTNETNSQPILSAYNIAMEDDSFGVLHCPNVFAQHPTVGCLKTTLNFFGMQNLIEKHLSGQKDEDTLSGTEIFVEMMNHPLFMNIVYPCDNPFSKLESFNNIQPIQDLMSNEVNWQKHLEYRSIKSHILNNIALRFAIMDGQHRVAISIHVLGGFEINNAFTTESVSTADVKGYEMTREMKINGKPTVRFVLPKSRTFDTEFMRKSVQASIEIMDRKLQAQQNPWRKVIQEVLETDKEKLTSETEYVQEDEKALQRFVFGDAIYDKNVHSPPDVVSMIKITRFWMHPIFRKLMSYNILFCIFDQ